MRIFKIVSATALMILTSLAYGQKTDDFLRTVVIDPGHGGHDPGAVSKDKKSYEKNLVLSISKLLGKKIKDEYGDRVKVYYTRSSDVFVPLQNRADFANGKNADLFISIHINASKSATSSGHSAHVLGASSVPGRDLVAGNLDVCKRENSVILLEDGHDVTYQGFDPQDDASAIFMTLMQSAYYEQSIYFASLTEEELSNSPITVKRGVEQNPFYVLWKTSMPAVLLELGFISNAADLAVLRTEAGRDKIAERVFRAFRTYKKSYDETMSLDTDN